MAGQEAWKKAVTVYCQQVSMYIEYIEQIERVEPIEHKALQPICEQGNYLYFVCF